MMAKMASFYGWTLEYIESLPYGELIEYHEAIAVLEGQERMVDMNIADYPRMKQDSRRKFHKEMRKIAHPTHLREPMSFEEFARRMNG